MAKLEKPIARRYARAAIDLAQSKGVLEAVAQDLDAVASLMTSNKELRHALLSPSFLVEQRRALLLGLLDAKPAGKDVQELTRTLIKLLVDKGRIPYIPIIAQAFRAEADRLLGRVRGTVESATTLSKEELESITAGLKAQVVSRKLGKDVVITSVVNPDLIAGVRATLGGVVFDGSLKNHLRRIGSELSA